MYDASQIPGTVTADPADAMPIGGTISIAPILVTYEGRHASAWLQDWASFEGILLSICFSSTDEHSVQGSAVLIAPGIAICARHVVDPVIASIMSGDHGITCFGITEKGLRVWRVRKYTQVAASDLAILGLELASEFESGGTLYQSTITTRLPQEGEELLLCGFKASERSFPHSIPRLGGRILVSRGTVTARYVTGRDRVMMPWPCLEVSCPSWGGMSGGPVYDAQGMLVGIVSSSIASDGDLGPSFVSLTWPALAAKFEGGWPGPFFRSPTRLVDLDPRLCAIDKRDAIQVPDGARTEQDGIKYRVWE